MRGTHLEVPFFEKTGLSALIDETQLTVRSGLEAGLREPRGVPELRTRQLTAKDFHLLDLSEEIHQLATIPSTREVSHQNHSVFVNRDRIIDPCLLGGGSSMALRPPLALLLSTTPLRS